MSFPGDSQSHHLWRFSLLSDELLPPVVVACWGLEATEGITAGLLPAIKAGLYQNIPTLVSSLGPTQLGSASVPTGLGAQDPRRRNAWCST